MNIDNYKIISFGSKVLVRLEGKEKQFEIVQGKDINPAEGKISSESPIGRSLLRKREKERFGLILPNRKVIDCEILKIF